MDEYWFPFQETMMRSASLVFFYMCLDQNLNALGNDTSWYDPNLGRYENKDRMKHFGGSLMSYKIHMYENLILGSQKLYEDFLYNFKRAGGPQIKLWDSTYDDEKQVHVVRVVNSIANIIKHSGSAVVAGPRQIHSKYLIENGYSNDGDYFKSAGAWEKLMKQYGFPRIAYLSKLGIDRLMYLNLRSEGKANWLNRYTDSKSDYRGFLEYAIPENLHEKYNEYWP